MDINNWWRDLLVAASLLAAANEHCCPQNDKNQDNRSQGSCIIGGVKLRVGLGCYEVQLVKQVQQELLEKQVQLVQQVR